MEKYMAGLLDWVNEYPWARRHLWAAVIVDHLYLASDMSCWLTSGQEVWMTRKNVDGEPVAVAINKASKTDEVADLLLLRGAGDAGRLGADTSSNIWYR